MPFHIVHLSIASATKCSGCCSSYICAPVIPHQMGYFIGNILLNMGEKDQKALIRLKGNQGESTLRNRSLSCSPFLDTAMFDERKLHIKIGYPNKCVLCLNGCCDAEAINQFSPCNFFNRRDVNLEFEALFV